MLHYFTTVSKYTTLYAFMDSRGHTVCGVPPHMEKQQQNYIFSICQSMPFAKLSHYSIWLWPRGTEVPNIPQKGIPFPSMVIHWILHLFMWRGSYQYCLMNTNHPIRKCSEAANIYNETKSAHLPSLVKLLTMTLPFPLPTSKFAKCEIN